MRLHEQLLLCAWQMPVGGCSKVYQHVVDVAGIYRGRSTSAPFVMTPAVLETLPGPGMRRT